MPALISGIFADFRAICTLENVTLETFISEKTGAYLHGVGGPQVSLRSWRD